MRMTRQTARAALWALLLLGAGPTVQAACGDPATSIESIQGTGDRSPLVGETVTVEATVTAKFQGDDALDGFFLQEPDRDARRSHGVFIYSRKAVTAGERVRLTGRVTEYHGLTELTRVRRLTRCGSTEPVTPQPLDWLDAHWDREALEGVLVRLPPSVITAHDHLLRYGQVQVGPRRRNLNREQDTVPYWILDDGRHSTHPDTIPVLNAFPPERPLRLGATLNPVTAVVGYSFGDYRLYPTVAVTPALSPERPEAPKKPTNSLRLVSLNAHNLFNGDGSGSHFLTDRGPRSASEYRRQLNHLTRALAELQSDLIVLNEIENDGFGDDSTVADLTRALNRTDPGPADYRAIEFRPRQTGTGAIQSVMLYNAHRLAPQGDSRSILDSPDFRTGFRRHRPALAQRFQVTGTVFEWVAVANHLKSKAGRCPSDTEQSRRRFGACNDERVQGVAQTLAWLSDWVPPDTPVYLLGDFNAYQHEPPIAQLREGGFSNPDLTVADYSYVYQGGTGTLDYILSNQAGLTHWVASGYWPINADALEPSRHQSLRTSVGTPRFSDHDPVYLDLALPARTAPVSSD